MTERIFRVLFLVMSVSLFAHAEPAIPHALVRNLTSKTAECDDKISIVESDDGSVEIQFRDMIASRSLSRPFMKCQFVGEVVVPENFTVMASQPVDAHFAMTFSQPGDQGGGRFRLELDSSMSSSMAMMGSQSSAEGFSITLMNAVPMLTACGGERVYTLHMSVEAMINYHLDQESSVTSRLDAIRIPALNLVPSTCTEEVP